MRQGVSMPEVLIRPAEPKKKKKEGACDAVARIVIGVEQELRDKKGQRC